MKTQARRVVPILILAAIAAVIAMWLNGTGSAWAESPMSPVSPISPIPPPRPTPVPPTENDEERDCLHRCIVLEGRTAVYCYARCVPFQPPRPGPGEWLFMQECLDEGFSEEQCRAWLDKPLVGTIDEPPAPTTTPVSVQPGCPGWWEELEPWMGIYELRTNGTEYCIGPKLN